VREERNARPRRNNTDGRSNTSFCSKNKDEGGKGRPETKKRPNTVFPSRSSKERPRDNGVERGERKWTTVT